MSTTGSQWSAGHRRRALAGLAAVALALAGCARGDADDDAGGATTTSSTAGAASTTTTDVGVTAEGATTDLVLDRSNDHGDRYADGILPVGDGKVVLDGPEQGFVYLCREGGEGGGADVRGPWFVNGDTEYDLNLKISVQGEVTWDGTYAVEVDGDVRRVTTNDVPDDHPTGQFPVDPDDPAYEYDRNPNTISEQDLAYELDATPEVADEPSCMGGESGVMNTGVALFNALDAGNRDAGAWEVQDSCEGHPEVTGAYHYHTLSSCIDDVSVDTIIGWALDGFPITGPTVGEGNVLTTADLDECHGITSTLDIDGEQVTTYHYVMTQDFPYSVSCFRGTPAESPRLEGGAPAMPPGG